MIVYTQFKDEVLEILPNDPTQAVTAKQIQSILGGHEITHIREACISLEKFGYAARNRIGHGHFWYRVS